MSGVWGFLEINSFHGFAGNSIKKTPLNSEKAVVIISTGL